MNNEDKILSILETLVIKVDKLEQNQTRMQSDVKDIKQSQSMLERGQIKLEQGQFKLEQGQAGLEQDVAEIKADVKDVKAQLRYAWEDIDNLDSRTIKLEKAKASHPLPIRRHRPRTALHMS